MSNVAKKTLSDSVQGCIMKYVPWVLNFQQLEVRLCLASLKYWPYIVRALKECYYIEWEHL